MADIIDLDNERNKRAWDEPKSFLEKTDEVCRKSIVISKEEYEIIQVFINHSKTLSW